MAEDKESLKKWFADMKTLINQSKKINDQIEDCQKELQTLQQEKMLNNSQREEYAQKVLGKIGTDEEVLTALRNKLQEIYQCEMQASFKDIQFNSTSEFLFAWHETTPIMDRFAHSQEPFLT